MQLSRLYFQVSRIGLFCLLGILLFGNGLKAQDFRLPQHKTRESISFKFIKNLIIIPVSINNGGPYNFILDTGVGLSLITDQKLKDSLNVDGLRTVKVSGLGPEDELLATLNPGFEFKIGSAVAENFPAAILNKDVFSLSEYVGMPIHGLIGYGFFNSFVVKISYSSQQITIFNKKSQYIPRKGYKIPINLEDQKPYLDATICLKADSSLKIKVIMDTGAGHPLSLENQNGGAFPVPEVNIAENLGVGLGGAIRGYMGRISSVSIGKYTLKNVITAFPEYTDVGSKITTTGRNGNLGNVFFKHFDLVLDYGRKVLYLKPSIYYKEGFEHNMSGLEFSSPEPDYKRLLINRVAPGSAGDLAGFEPGDEILRINLKPVANWKMDEIDNLFRSGDGRNFFIEYVPKAGGKRRTLVFTLKRRI